MTNEHSLQCPTTAPEPPPLSAPVLAPDSGATVKADGLASQLPGHHNVIFHENGSWFYWDEIGDKCGPFATSGEAATALATYCDEHFGDSIEIEENQPLPLAVRALMALVTAGACWFLVWQIGRRVWEVCRGN